MTHQSSEPVYFNEKGVLVTASRFVSGNQTFPMGGITSVKRGRVRPHYFKWAFVSFALALLATGVGREHSSTLIGGIFGLFVLYAIFSRTRHVVLISTAAGEVSAYSSKDRAVVDRIVAALTESIIQRG